MCVAGKWRCTSGVTRICFRPSAKYAWKSFWWNRKNSSRDSKIKEANMARRLYRVLEVHDQFLVVTDEAKFEGSLCTFRCSRTGVEGAKINDKISADTTLDHTVVENPFPEVGDAAVYLRPVKFEPEVKDAFNPNDTGDAPLLYPDGSPLSALDIDQMLREQQKQIASLVARVSLIEFRQPKHCSVCSAHLASGAFDR
jgi:hypothetical protein